MTGEAMLQVPDTSAEAMPVKAFRASWIGGAVLRLLSSCTHKAS